MYKHCRTKKVYSYHRKYAKKKRLDLTLQTLFFILWEKTKSCKEMNTVFILIKFVDKYEVKRIFFYRYRMESNL